MLGLNSIRRLLLEERGDERRDGGEQHQGNYDADRAPEDADQPVDPSFPDRQPGIDSEADGKPEHGKDRHRAGEGLGHDPAQAAFRQLGDGLAQCANHAL